MLRSWLWLVPLLVATPVSSAQDADARRVVSRYDAMRPDASELGMYRLDWVESLDEALDLAATEKRPIFLVIIHAKYGDITAGHC